MVSRATPLDSPDGLTDALLYSTGTLDKCYPEIRFAAALLLAPAPTTSSILTLSTQRRPALPEPPGRAGRHRRRPRRARQLQHHLVAREPSVHRGPRPVQLPRGPLPRGAARARRARARVRRLERLGG